MNKRFSVSIDENTHQMLKDLCEKHEIKMGEVVRELLFMFVTKMENKDLKN